MESLIKAKLTLKDISKYLESSFRHIFVKFTVLMILGCLVVIIMLPEQEEGENQNGKLSVEQ